MVGVFEDDCVSLEVWWCLSRVGCCLYGGYFSYRDVDEYEVILVDEEYLNGIGCFIIDEINC